MSDQPEALKWAADLNQRGLVEAAAELRRQHSEIETFKAERDALRDALQNVMGILSKAESNASGNPEWDYAHSCVDAARAALKARSKA